MYKKFHQFLHYLHINIPIYKKQEKLIHDFILYTTNFLQQNEMIIFETIHIPTRGEQQDFIQSSKILLVL